MARLRRRGPVAAQLNRLVVDALWEAGVPVLRIQPSASACCREGELLALDERPLITALRNGLAPVVHGDVALDDVRGGTIVSTEAIFRWLAPRLHPQRVVLVGEVEGVLTADPASGVKGEVIDAITPATLPRLAGALGGSRGSMSPAGWGPRSPKWLHSCKPTVAHLCASISGLTPGLVRRVLIDPRRAETRIIAA